MKHILITAFLGLCLSAASTKAQDDDVHRNGQLRKMKNARHGQFEDEGSVVNSNPKANMHPYTTFINANGSVTSLLNAISEFRIKVKKPKSIDEFLFVSIEANATDATQQVSADAVDIQSMARSSFAAKNAALLYLVAMSKVVNMGVTAASDLVHATIPATQASTKNTKRMQ